MKCPRCGAINDNNEQFCYNCGLRLEAPAPSSAGAPTILIPSPDQQQSPPQQPQAGGTYPPSYGPPVPTPPYNPSPYGAPTPPPYNQQPYGTPYGTQPLYPAIPSTSTAAVVSLVFGILSWLFLFGIGGIVAVIAGHVARGNIRRSNGTVDGGGMALAGLILGYLNILAAALLCTLVVAALVLGGISGN